MRAYLAAVASVEYVVTDEMAKATMASMGLGQGALGHEALEDED